MKRSKTWRERLLWRLACLLTAALPLVVLLSAVIAGADDNTDPAWAMPDAMAIKRVSAVDISQHEPTLLSNLDCDLTDYRVVGSDVMQTGCFTRTAFGLIDSDSGMTIFNGTDEGLPLMSYSAHQVLAPWPQALNLLTLDGVSTGGSYVGFYKNPLSVVRDQRDQLLKLTAKQLTAPPEASLEDPAGKPLVINPQTLAFSSNGAWLVAETLGGVFVRINLATLDVLPFAPSYGMSGSPALLKSQVAVSDDGNYIAIANNAAQEMRVYDLTGCGNTGAGWQDRRCAEHDYRSFAQQQIPGLQTIRHVRFVNDGLLSFEVRAADSANNGVYELAPRDSIKSLVDYLALGDSYTSGEGAFDYLAGTDTADNLCHLSANSYPLLLTRALFSASGGHSVACSGAVINDVGSTSPDYRGQARGVATFRQLQQTQAETLNSIMAGYAPGYVAQQQFVRQYQPAVATISIGGNDIGFGDIIENCAAPHVSLRRGGNDCYNTYEDRRELTLLIDRAVPRWSALYKQLAAEAPGARLYAVGYPQIASDTGNCALNVHLSQTERAFAEELMDYLNNDIRQAAANAGVTYVDISQALVGHRLCEAASYDVAVNGLTAGKDASVLGMGIFGKESYHPNALGQALIEQAVLEQTHNLTGQATAGTGNVGPGILDAPKTGRQINVIVPSRLTETVLRAGKSVSVKADGPASGLKARSIYTVRLHGGDGRVVGTTASNDRGDIATSFTLPDDVEAGGQTIDVTGENQAGEPVDLTQPVYVPVSDGDADGDSIPDATDSCPGAVNSGQDVDRDGIDDVCDNSVSPPLTVGQGNADNSGGTDNAGLSDSDLGKPTGSGDAGLGQAAASVTVFSGHVSGIQSLGRFLGGQTVDPVAARARTIRPSSPSRPTVHTKQARPPMTRLPVINWVLWAKLLIIVWLVLAIGLGFSRLVAARSRLKRPSLPERMYQKRQFSITIDE